MNGLILASFGTLEDAERARTLDAIESDFIAAFPTLKIVSALTSNFIRRRLRARGIAVRSIEERIEEFRAEGIDTITILPTHLTPGEEFEQKILPFVSERVRVMQPLFTADCRTEFDRRAFEVVIDCFRPSDDEELVLIGHGSPHRHNPVYENLQRLNERVHIGVIEPSDRPNFGDVLARLHESRAKKILLAPLLLTGGAHVNEDIAGDCESSWLSRLRAEGFEVRTRTEGLGAFQSFRQLYVDRFRLSNAD